MGLAEDAHSEVEVHVQYDFIFRHGPCVSFQRARSYTKFGVLSSLFWFVGCYCGDSDAEVPLILYTWLVRGLVMLHLVHLTWLN
jgi:hypothetical protein